MHAGRPDATSSTGRDWRLAAADRFPHHRLIERRRFVMQDDLVALVREGRKRSTIRFDEHGLEYPAGEVLPIYAVGSGRAHHEAAPAGEVILTGLEYVRCGDLSTAHAKADGFRSRGELVEALVRFYPSIKPDSLVCVYTFAPVEGGAGTDAERTPRAGRRDTAGALEAAV